MQNKNTLLISCPKFIGRLKMLVLKKLADVFIKRPQSTLKIMDELPIVRIKNGQLQGTIKNDWKGKVYYSFQGIPYGKPPVGSLRFKAPLPAESWTGIRDASIEGDECYARDMLKQLVGSENCLFLNVYTPELPDNRSKLKPVMVWIHGGGFIGGSGNSDVYGPDFLIAEDVVVVTINYRVGLLGFACFDDPSLNIPGNAGLKDQVLALKWVQQNISSFCGDPRNVTIFGESAGGACVHYLMLSPMSKGLFHKAISQSAVATSLWTRGQRTASLVAEALQLNTTNEAEIAKIMQELPVEELFAVQEKIPDPLVICDKHPIGPVVEKASREPAFLLEDPVKLIKSGRFNQVPFMVGYNSREGMLLESRYTELFGQMQWLTDFENAVPFDLNFPRGSSASISVANQIKEFYYGYEEPSHENISQYYILQTDCFFFTTMNYAVRLQTASSATPIYYYRISLDTELNIFKRIGDLKNAGTCHGDDLGYLFKNVLTPEIREGSAEDISLHRIIKLWTNFAKTGNPNPVTKDSLINVTWLPTQPNKLHFLDIGENLTVGVNPEIARVKFWDRIYSLTGSTSKL